MPGSLGLPIGSTDSTDGGDPNSGAVTIVNRTIFHSPIFSPNGIIPIPPTTAGNTLVIVQNSFWFPDYPRFNGKTAGWLDDAVTFTPNTVDVGIFGGSGIPGPLDTPPGPGSPQNAGSLIAYFTNIAGGVSQISYGDISRGTAYPPEWTIIYELSPCIVFDGNPVYTFIDEGNTSGSDPVGVPVNGPDGIAAIYFTGMTVMKNGAPGSLLASVNAPWQIDYQNLLSYATPQGGCAAFAIIPSESGPQQALWSGDGGDDWVSAAICLVSTGGGGGTPPPPPPLEDQFLPNVWIVS